MISRKKHCKQIFIPELSRILLTINHRLFGGTNISLHMKATPAPDFFAEIATAQYSACRAALVFPLRPDKSALDLRWQHSAPARRVVVPDVRTAADVKARLELMRQQYAPYMANHAPPVADLRSRLDFDTFEWRIEQAADRRDFARVLAGGGDWETVRLPHYGPPLGKAATVYRSTFELPAWADRHAVMALHFGGVDYRCQVYVNGLCVGTHEGFFEQFRLDCTAALRPGSNTLLVRVENDYTMLGENTGGITPDGDKVYAATGLGYDEPELGWHHCPAGMGIWNYVRLVGTSRLYIDDFWVRPLLDSQEIEVNLEVESRSPDLEETVAFAVSVYGQNFEAVVHADHVHRGEAGFVRGFGDLVHGFNDVFPTLLGSGRNYIRFRLPLPDARLWTPETPWLYQAQVKLLDAAEHVLDTSAVQFGMRSFVQDANSTPCGKFYLNGEEIRLRGANTMGNFERCIMQGDMDGLRDQILLAKLTRMNFLRLTQRPVHREFYDYCDRLGMMTQTDLPLFSTIRRTQFNEVARQAGCMERHVRAHCSNILVSFMNEPRPAAGSKPHRFVDREEMEDLFEMAAHTVRFNNPDRVIKLVDGDYDPPTRTGMPDNHVYCGWYIGHGVDLGALHQGHWLPIKPGWHYGCGEFGAEGLDSYPVMKACYPEGWKPASLDAPWDPRVIAMAQSYKFHFLWYDAGATAREWIEASQAHQAWVIGLMTKAYRCMPGMNTFAVHLFIDAWPAGWMKSIMDVHCTPKQAWFAYRHALAPLAVFLRSDRTQVWGGEQLAVEVWICNDHPRPRHGLRLQLEMLLDGQPLATAATSADVPACQPTCLGIVQLKVPAVVGRSSMEIGVTLVDEGGQPVHEDVLSLEVFPPKEPVATAVRCCGDPAVLAPFVAALGASVAADAGPAAVWCVYGAAAFATQWEAVRAAVIGGATAVVIDLPVGTYPIGPQGLTVYEVGMGPRHFVSRATGHPLVDGFRSQDFKFWFNGKLGRVAPLLYTLVDAPEGVPVLNSGDGGWTKPWDYTPAAVEICEGKGRWRVVQIDLPAFVAHNPAAWAFASRLLQASLCPENK
jgi:hypothetical protein